ncbi:hypothetical protein RSAG8_13861, partial [Rhizoctonia solani AG-8 WAC10335]
MPLSKHPLSGLLNRRGDGREWRTRVSTVGRNISPTQADPDKGALILLKCRAGEYIHISASFGGCSLCVYAALDDCDWNGHLSNSSYAKNLDPARMNMLLSWFPAFINDGGMAAFGGLPRKSEAHKDIHLGHVMKLVIYMSKSKLNGLFKRLIET